MVITIVLGYEAVVDKDWTEVLAWGIVLLYESIELGNVFDKEK